VLFLSMLMASNSSLMVEKCPSSFEINMRSNIHNRVQIWTLTCMAKTWAGLFSSHFMVVFAVWTGTLSCWKIMSDHSFLEQLFIFRKQDFLQYFQKQAPHTITITIQLEFHCDSSIHTKLPIFWQFFKKIFRDSNSFLSSAFS